MGIRSARLGAGRRIGWIFELDPWLIWSYLAVVYVYAVGELLILSLEIKFHRELVGCWLRFVRYCTDFLVCAAFENNRRSKLYRRFANSSECAFGDKGSWWGVKRERNGEDSIRYTVWCMIVWSTAVYSVVWAWWAWLKCGLMVREPAIDVSEIRWWVVELASRPLNLAVLELPWSILYHEKKSVCVVNMRYYLKVCAVEAEVRKWH